MERTALIKIWGELAGAVAWDENTGYSTFEYDSKFKNRNWDLAPLQMSINSASNDFSFPALRKKTDAELDTFKGCCKARMMSFRAVTIASL